MMDVVPFKTSFIFGVSEWELFLPLLHGATLATTREAQLRTPAAFCAALELSLIHI